MNTQTHTPANANANVNAGILAMRRTLEGMAACRALGLTARDASTPKPAKPAKAPRTPPSERSQTPDADEPTHAWRVCLLVKAGDGALTHVCSEHTAAGPRRAGKQARIAALAAGLSPVAVVATVREDAPAPVWAAVA